MHSRTPPPTEATPATAGNSPSETRGKWWIFSAVVAAFLLLRTPVMYLSPGGQDEDCYGVPGMTILQTGLPQLPHVPARNPESVYYFADRQLFSEPPLMFYVQALFYLVLPDTIGTARMMSAVCGLVALGVLWRLGNRWLGAQGTAVLCGVALFSVSRWFYFAATCARPDMLATLLGFLTLAAVCRWESTRQIRWLVWAGMAIGLGGLTHPFAMAYAIQAAALVALNSRRWSRLGNPLLVAGIAILTAGLWLPLILLEPDAFRVQFSNQFLGSQDAGLLQRLTVPWNSLWYHTRFMWQHLGPWQFLLGVGPLVLASVWSVLKRDRDLLALCALSWSGFYLIAAFVGPHHPTLGYWSYPGGLMFLTTGWCVAGLVRWLGDKVRAPRAVEWAAALILLMALIPGSGIRTFIAQLRNWGDPKYNVIAFSRELMARIPADQLCIVDTQFALEFVAARRKVLLAQTIPFYFEADKYPYDKLIVSRYGLQTGIAGRMCTTSIQWTQGDKDDLFACYAEVYQQAEFPCPPEKQTPLVPTGQPF